MAEVSKFHLRELLGLGAPNISTCQEAGLPSVCLIISHLATHHTDTHVIAGVEHGSNP